MTCEGCGKETAGYDLFDWCEHCGGNYCDDCYAERKRCNQSPSGKHEPEPNEPEE